jgi:hypothetical protein
MIISTFGLFDFWISLPFPTHDLQAGNTDDDSPGDVEPRLAWVAHLEEPISTSDTAKAGSQHVSKDALNTQRIACQQRLTDAQTKTVEQRCTQDSGAFTTDKCFFVDACARMVKGE